MIIIREQSERISVQKLREKFLAYYEYSGKFTLYDLCLHMHFRPAVHLENMVLTEMRRSIIDIASERDLIFPCPVVVRDKVRRSYSRYIEQTRLVEKDGKDVILADMVDLDSTARSRFQFDVQDVLRQNLDDLRRDILLMALASSIECVSLSGGWALPTEVAAFFRGNTTKH